MFRSTCLLALLPSLLALGLLPLVPAGLLDARPLFSEDQAPLSDEEVARLIEQLGSMDFGQREEASKRLATLGEPGLPLLRKALASDDPEVRRRARDLIRALERRLFGPRLCLRGHTHSVVACALSRDGLWALSASNDCTI